MQVKSIGAKITFSGNYSVPTKLSIVNLLVALTNERSRENIENMLNSISKLDLIDLSIERIEIYGFTKAVAKKIYAAIQFALEINKKVEKGFIVRNPEDAAKLFMHLQFEKQEHLVVVGLNDYNEVLLNETIFIGTLSETIVHPREIMQKLLFKNGIASFLIGHNHPAGPATPSKFDLDFTSQLKQVGQIMGVELKDHIIVGDYDYISLKEKGYFI